MDPVRQRIETEQVTAAYSVSEAFSGLADRFRAMGSEVFRDKARDILDLERRLIDRLLGRTEDRIATLIRSERLEWDGEISVVYQSIDGLREAMPGHTGDWYFTGEYPTPGGFRVLNTAYLNWRRQDERRAY